MTSFAVAPRIETERLILRPHRARDFETLYEMWTDPGLYRHIGGKPSTPYECWRRLLVFGGLWPILGYGYWAVEEKASGLHIGDAGFADFHRDEPVGFSGDPEIGYGFSSRVHGNGYGKEAVAACMDWMDTHHPGRRTICMIDPENTASIRIAEGLGYRKYGEGKVGEKALVLMERV